MGTRSGGDRSSSRPDAGDVLVRAAALPVQQAGEPQYHEKTGPDLEGGDGRLIGACGRPVRADLVAASPDLRAGGAVQESGREDKAVAAKAGKSRCRNRRKPRWSGLRRRRGAARRAKKAPRVVKEEEEAAEWESSPDVKPAVAEAEKATRSRKRAGSSRRARRPGAAKRAKKTPIKEEKMEEDELAEEEEDELAEPEEEEEAAEGKPAASAPVSVSPRGKVDRWSAWRYAAGEAVLLDILRARGATAGKPAPRAELRAQARRHIGDTGLLDHLLRHVADKVPAGSAERVRRRYNPAGGLEYWLEPAELAATRRVAGVDDPFWVPPSGWKPGDPVSPEARTLKVQKQVEELAEELDVVKRQMKQLDSNLVQVSKEAYISWKGYDCMVKANGNLEKEVLVFLGCTRYFSNTIYFDVACLMHLIQLSD